jgi:hypothetical protein
MRNEKTSLALKKSIQWPPLVVFQLKASKIHNWFVKAVRSPLR